jgi:hypothetical protein
MINSTIYRERSADPFCRIPNETLQDPSLSFKAKGVLAYLLSKPDGWKPQAADIANHSTDGPSAIASAVKELREQGYAELQKHIRNGRVTEWRLIVADCCKFLSQGKVVTIAIVTKEPQALFPDVENPEGDSPDLENRGHSNTDKSNTEKSNTEVRESKVLKVNGHFQKPTLEAMRLHGAKIGLPDSEVERCFNHYESNGWRVGRNPMKSWQAAMVNWRSNWQEKRFHNGNGRSEAPVKTLWDKLIEEETRSTDRLVAEMQRPFDE